MKKVETLSWKDTKAKDNNRDHETGDRQDWRKLGSGYPSLGAKQMTLYFSGVDTGLDKDMSHNGANTLVIPGIPVTVNITMLINTPLVPKSLLESASTILSLIIP